MQQTPDLDGFRPNADALLPLISAHLIEADLEEIARKDYGHDVEEHLGVLRRIAHEGHVPLPIQWHPKEVLQLASHEEPRGELSPAAIGRIGWRRAFACAALLRAYGEPANQDVLISQNLVLVQLLGTLRRLDGDLDRAAMSFLAWIVPRLPEGAYAENIAFALALLWCALPAGSGASDRDLVALIEWIAQCEDSYARAWRERGAIEAPYGPLLLSINGIDSPYVFAEWLADRSQAGRSPAVTEGIELLIASLLSKI